MRRPGNVVPLVSVRTAVRVDHAQVELDEQRAHRLRTAAREHGTSIEVMVQVAWSILLDALAGDGELDETMPIRSLLVAADHGRPAEAAVRVGPGEIDARVWPHGPGAQARLPRGCDRARLEVCLTPGVTLRLRYPTDSFERCVAEKLVDCLLRVLEAMAIAPDQPICRVEVLGDEDRRCIQGRWTDVAAPDLTVVELFEDQVDRAPHAVAMAAGEYTLSYRELDRAANRLASRLIAQETDPPTPILLALPVSADLVVGLLAALKAGTDCLITPGRIGGRARCADAMTPSGAGHQRSHPDTRPPRLPRVTASTALVTVSGVAHDDVGVTVHHGELLKMLLNGCIEQTPAVTAPARSSAESPTDLITTVLLPLITGATLVVMPDAVAVN